MPSAVRAVAARLGYQFNDVALLERALTHRSAGRAHNERLEFLGDAVLDFLIADELFHRFPKVREGKLTRMRARLVRRETLAELARRVEIGAVLQLGGGELKSGGRDRDSILADAFEALLGAVYLDGGLDACREVLLNAAAEQLDGLDEGAAGKDPKTALQEWLQQRHLPLPVYSVRDVMEEGQESVFVVECRLAEPGETVLGRGHTRRRAEQNAAREALGLVARTEVGGEA